MRDIYEELLYTHEDIVKRCEELGKLISEDYKGKTPIVVGMLNGAVPFMAELIKHITVDLEIDFIKASSYSGTKSTLDVKIKKDLDRDIKGRDIIIVEDIIDTGYTLEKVLPLLEEKEPNSIEICTLLDKPAGRLIDFRKVKYVGFTIEPKFVVGFGLDYDELYRNTDDIGVLKKEIYMK